MSESKTKVKFIHAGDLHLGHRQYNSKERFKDFNRAFNWLLNFTYEQKADFLLISGDFFETSYLSPEVILYAYQKLEEFKNKTEGKCPVIVIEGNHDMRRYGMLRSWLQFLCETSLIILLDATYLENSQIEFNQFDFDKKKGGYINIKDINIYGLRYQGSITRDLFNKIYNKINTDGFNILMMHFGIEGYLDKTDPVEYDAKLDLLKNKVNYLALAHYHKAYIEHGWIFNPGSLESNEFPEYNYERGVFVVEIDPTSKQFNYQFVDVKEYNRKFILLNVDIGISKLKTFIHAKNYILDRLSNKLVSKSQEIIKVSNLSVPVVNIILKGVIGYPRSEIDVNALKREIEDRYNVLLVRIHNECLTQEESIYLEQSDQFDFNIVESEILLQQISADSIFSRVANDLIPLAKQIKNGLLEKHSVMSMMLKDIEDFWDKYNLEEYFNDENATKSAATTTKTINKVKDKSKSDVKEDSKPSKEPSKKEEKQNKQLTSDVKLSEALEKDKTNLKKGKIKGQSNQSKKSIVSASNQKKKAIDPSKKSKKRKSKSSSFKTLDDLIKSK
ncbi:MAG: metallophosphoesterase family protein [Promethearchaeota archaeon]